MQHPSFRLISVDLDIFINHPGFRISRISDATSVVHHSCFFLTFPSIPVDLPQSSSAFPNNPSLCFFHSSSILSTQSPSYWCFTFTLSLYSIATPSIHFHHLIVLRPTILFGLSCSCEQRTPLAYAELGCVLHHHHHHHHHHHYHH